MPREIWRHGAIVATVLLTTLVLCGCGGPAARQARYEKRGQEYLAAGKLEKARVEFRNALQIAPASSRVRYENGVVAERLGGVQEAARFYVGAIEADADNVAARASLGKVLVLSGLPDMALQYVNPGLVKHKDDARLLSVHATALSLKKDQANALLEAQRAVTLAPDSEDAIAALAAVQLAAGQLDLAVKGVQAALTRSPDSIELRRILVQVFLRANDDSGTERELKDLARLQPHEKFYRLQLAQLYARSGRPDDAERTLRTAIADIPDASDLKTSLIEFLWAQRSRTVAESELNRMIAATPNDRELQFTLARLYEQSNDLPHAEAEYRKLIESGGKGPDGVRARDRLAALYTVKQDQSGADKLISQVLDENPGDNDALVLRAEEELSRSQPEAAITDLRRVLRDQPNSTPLLLVLTRAYVADGEPQLAEEAARRAVEIDPSDPTARTELARAFIRMGKFEDGRTLLYALDKQRPDDPIVLDLIYRASIALKDTSAAQAAAEELVKVRPNSGIGQLNLGILLEAAGRKEEALADYRKAFELQPNAAEPLKAIVLLFKRAKRYDEAIALLDQVAARQPQSPLAPTLKGEILLAEGGHLQDANAAFRSAVQRAPKWWDPYRGIVAVDLANRNPKAAVASLKEAVAHAQLLEPERLELASLFTTAGEPEESMKQYDELLKKNPKSLAASADLAMLLVSYRTDDVSLNRAVTLVRPLANTQDWRLLDAFGWVHFKNQDFTGALPALEKASGERPDVAQLHFHLGMAQLKAGQSDQAEKNLAAAVGPGDFFLGRDEAKAVLAQLRSRAGTS